MLEVVRKVKGERERKKKKIHRGDDINVLTKKTVSKVQFNLLRMYMQLVLFNKNFSREDENGKDIPRL